MKRKFINSNNRFMYVPTDIPEELKEYADNLRLLNDVPLTYLLSDVSDLSEESIRFGMVDVNWTDAYLDGALSIGRVCGEDGVTDKTALKCMGQKKGFSATPRMKKMHPNHKKQLLFSAGEDELQEDFSVISVVLIRSQLVKVIKGINLYGYDDNEELLPILRMEVISEDILICLFHGILHKLMIAEPQTGLRFGCSDFEITDNGVTRKIDLRSASDDEGFGSRIDYLCVDKYVDSNGRIHAKGLSEEIEKKLKESKKLDSEKITPSRFAYEMISIAHRAAFYASENVTDNKEVENA